MILEERKKKEIEHSDRRRRIVQGNEYRTDSAAGETDSRFVAKTEQYERHFSNMKFYCVTRSSEEYYKRWLAAKCGGKVTLDYCCGNGDVALHMARHGATVHGIDISGVAIENARAMAEDAGLSEKTNFQMMDAEDMDFKDGFFDHIFEYGALHHLEYEKAVSEAARVLKPGGSMICVEALGYNPIIQWYRRRTPHLRTRWEAEHIIKMPQIRMARKHFGRVSYRFFHMGVLAAVPFMKTRMFGPLLSALESVDSVLLKGQRWAWMVVFTLEDPLKEAA